MDLEQWLSLNAGTVDWSLFGPAWDEMQLRHNPFRQEQISAILEASGVFHAPSPTVLDLGCGPGILGRVITQKKPDARYVGADGDPLMLMAMGHLLGGRNARGLLVDLRRTDWSRHSIGRPDAIVSLSALHWLSERHQKDLYRTAFEMLPPAGMLVVGDLYLPQRRMEKEKLAALQEERTQLQTGQTWEQFWKRFFDKYPIKALYDSYHLERGYRQPCEGTDEGCPLSFHMGALQEAGFTETAVFWQKGLRAVFGARR